MGPQSHLYRQRRTAVWDHGPTFTVTTGLLSGTMVPPLPSAPDYCLGPRSHLYRQRRNAAWDHGPTFTVSTGAIPKTFVLTHPIVLEEINGDNIY